jgi:prepilin-type N-terminal cleavage/methylation domain-containing protein
MVWKAPARGFTLAELLIALLILGGIATFTIPKILSSQQLGQNKAVIKETFATIASAYSMYTLNNGASSSITMGALTPYMNYIAVDTTSIIDQPGGTYDCSASGLTCIKLHNGAILYYSNGVTFAGTNTTNALWFEIDPDGKNNATSQSSPGAGIWGFIYYNGRLSTHGGIVSGTVSSDMTRDPDSALDPTWFNWN